MGLTTTTAGRPKNTCNDKDEYDLIELGKALDDDSFAKVAVLDTESFAEEIEQDMDKEQQAKDETYKAWLDKAYVGMLGNTAFPPQNVFDCYVYVDGFLRSYDSAEYRTEMCSMCLHIDTFGLACQNCGNHQGHNILFKNEELARAFRI